MNIQWKQMYLYFSACRIKEFSQAGQNTLTVEDESNRLSKAGNPYSQAQRHTTGKLLCNTDVGTSETQTLQAISNKQKIS